MTTTETQAQGVIPPLTLKVRLRVAREYAGLDQRAMAAAIDVAHGTYSNWESGNASPRGRDMVAVARRIQDATGVSASWLLGLDPVTYSACNDNHRIPAPRARHVRASRKVARFAGSG
jgi:transcriptional regulator with XRE-family HTH domain